MTGMIQTLGNLILLLRFDNLDLLLNLSFMPRPLPMIPLPLEQSLKIKKLHSLEILNLEIMMESFVDLFFPAVH
jgi:hypothetical protein